MRVYSTSTVDPSQRLRYWSALNSTAMIPMRVSARQDVGFDGRLWVDRIGVIDLAHSCSSGATITRTPLRPSRAVQRERAYLVSVAEGGDYIVHSRGRTSTVRAGDLRMYNSEEQGDVAHNGCAVTVLRVKECVFKAYVPAADELVGLSVPGDRGAGLHASTMIRSLANDMRHGYSSRVGEHLAAALLYSVAAAFGDVYGKPENAPRSAESRRAEIRRFVDEHLTDESLTVRSVGDAIGLSDRYLRMLFERCDESVADYIQRRRLDEAARQLRDPSWRGATVSAIAFGWGFNSLGSFDRAFKARYRVTPTQYRGQFVPA